MLHLSTIFPPFECTHTQFMESFSLFFILQNELTYLDESAHRKQFVEAQRESQTDKSDIRHYGIIYHRSIWKR